ncbi:endonuclease/exonuclease/phosphatase family protein [Pedobacter frigoris]|uniref:endonuclease/exonuclease/phosphatase family protein n=1 Tax=Pedobacter frigoris TaxID=2571272 RepID=UPI00292E2860|nr:endonuclease/exonuclease/phosphatase family protein [Pedobacter frigoris]
MKKQLSIILILCTSVLFSCFAQKKSAGKKADVLKVMSYNVHHCNPPAKAGVIDIDAIAAVINSVKPDIVGLQEIDVKTGRSGKDINQAQELAKKTGMHFFFGKAIDHDGGEYGVALLSKYPVSETQVYHLTSLPEIKGEPRVLITAKLLLPSGRAIRFGNTHLDAERDPANRMAQIKEINAIAQKEVLPFVITGDFNAYPESEVIKEMDLAFTRTCQTCQPTIPADKPSRSIDFIGYATKHPLVVKGHEVIVAPEPSDHLPVAAVLELKAK